MVADEELEHVAETARLNLTDEERKQFSGDLDDILDAFETLDDINTEDVEPAFHPVTFEDGTREDVEESCLTQDEALANSENTEDSYFKGPRAV